MKNNESYCTAVSLRTLVFDDFKNPYRTYDDKIQVAPRWPSLPLNALDFSQGVNGVGGSRSGVTPSPSLLINK